MNNETIEIKKENVMAAYNEARRNGYTPLVNILEAMFCKETFQPKDITERVKTFGDALRELDGKEENHPFVTEFENLQGYFEEYGAISRNVIAYLKLRIICAALNEGWEPQFTKDECRYYPWFNLYTRQELDNMDEDEKKKRYMIDTGDYETEYCGFGCAYSYYVPSGTNAYIGSRLCLKSRDLAEYCGRQFINLWADFNLIRK